MREMLHCPLIPESVHTPSVWLVRQDLYDSPVTLPLVENIEQRSPHRETWRGRSRGVTTQASSSYHPMWSQNRSKHGPLRASQSHLVRASGRGGMVQAVLMVHKSVVVASAVRELLVQIQEVMLLMVKRHCKGTVVGEACCAVVSERSSIRGEKGGQSSPNMPARVAVAFACKWRLCQHNMMICREGKSYGGRGQHCRVVRNTKGNGHIVSLGIGSDDTNIQDGDTARMSSHACC